MDVFEQYKNSRQMLFDWAGIQPESSIVATNGPVKNVHYLKIGSGNPLILIHGGGSHSSEWVNILKPLAEHFELYVIDRPGCGLTDEINYRGVDYRQSAVDFIRSFMDAVGLEKSFLVGNSMGGYFSIYFAMQYPDRVKKLILIGAPTGINLWIPLQIRLMGVKGLNKFLAITIGKPNIKNIKMTAAQLVVADINNLTDDYFTHTYHSQLLPGYQNSVLTMFENTMTLRGWNKKLYLGDQLHKLKVPVGFIWGDKDALEKPESGKQKAKAIKNYEFEVVENAGHYPWLDKPEECSALIIKMLQD